MSMHLEIWHPVMAILAAFRLVDVFVADRVWDRPRRWWPQIPWTCVRCMSVWAGVVSTSILILLPWLAWPLALSWLYLAYGDWMVVRMTIRTADNQ